MRTTPTRGPLSLDDAQLVALAKSLPEPVLAEARREEMRTAFLSSVRGLPSGARTRAGAGRGRRRRLLLIGALLVTGAAAAAAWRLGSVPSSPSGAPEKPTAPAEGAPPRPPAAPPEAAPAAAQTVQKEPEPRVPSARPAKVALLGRREPAANEPGADVETEFARGWTALRTGDFHTAAEAFGRAAGAKDSQLAEDALFWRGVALDRAGRFGPARQALTDFLTRYPDSERKGEASAVLGWLLLHAGERQEARDRFTAALGDPADRVRNSARSGLDATAAPSP